MLLRICFCFHTNTARFARFNFCDWMAHWPSFSKNVYNLFSPGCKTFQRCFQMTSNSLGLTLNPSPLSHTFVYSRSTKGCRILKRCSISLKRMRSPCRRSSDRCCSEFVTKCEMSIASLLLPSNVVTAFPRLLATRHTMLRLTHQ